MGHQSGSGAIQSGVALPLPTALQICLWSAVAKRSGDIALDVSSSWGIRPAAEQSKAVWRCAVPPHSRFALGVRWQSEAATPPWMFHRRGASVRQQRIQSGVSLPLPTALQVCPLECGGKAKRKRRHRFGCFIVMGHPFGSGAIQSGVALPLPAALQIWTPDRRTNGFADPSVPFFCENRCDVIDSPLRISPRPQRLCVSLHHKKTDHPQGMVRFVRLMDLSRARRPSHR
jgi:hypothetical protein